MEEIEVKVKLEVNDTGTEKQIDCLTSENEQNVDSTSQLKKEFVQFGEDDLNQCDSEDFLYNDCSENIQVLCQECNVKGGMILDITH